jgi:hypothetical protein
MREKNNKSTAGIWRKNTQDIRVIDKEKSR